MAYSVKIGRSNSEVAYAITLFCLCNGAHHPPSKLSIQKAATFHLLHPNSLIQAAGRVIQRGLRSSDAFIYAEKRWMEVSSQQ